MSFFFTFFLLWKKLPDRKSRSIAVFLCFLFALEEAAERTPRSVTVFLCLLSFSLKKKVRRFRSSLPVLASLKY